MPHRLEQRAEEIMSHDVLTAPANAPIQEVVRAMVDRGKECVVVVDQGRPVGIVLERDLLPQAMRPICMHLERPELFPLRHRRQGSPNARPQTAYPFLPGLAIRTRAPAVNWKRWSRH